MSCAWVVKPGEEKCAEGVGPANSPAWTAVPAKDRSGNASTASRARVVTLVMMELLLARRPDVAVMPGDDAPGLHDIAAVGDTEGGEDVLLDEKHGHAFPAYVGQHAQKLVDDDGGETEAHLVDHEKPRRRHQRAAERAHLLLAAREAAGLL